MNEDRDLFAYSSPASSLDGSIVYMKDVMQVVQEAQNEQKLNTGKIIRAIMQGVMLMCMVMILCTLVLYFKPPYAQSVKYTQGDPWKNTTVNIVVNLHVYANASSFYDTPEDECSINDKKVYDMGLYDGSLLYKQEMIEKTFALFAGMGLGFTALVLPSPTP